MATVNNLHIYTSRFTEIVSITLLTLFSFLVGWILYTWQNQSNLTLLSKSYILLLVTIASFTLARSKSSRSDLLLVFLFVIGAIATPSLIWLGLIKREVIPMNWSSWLRTATPSLIALGLALSAWLIQKKAVCRIDLTLFVPPLVMFFLGLGMIQRIALEYAGVGRSEIIENMAFRQCAWLGIGLLVMTFSLRFGIRTRLARLCRKKNLFPLISAVMLIVTWLIGPEINDRRLWLSVGIFSFQTVEPVKLLLILYVVGYLVNDQFHILHSPASKLFSFNLSASGPLGVMLTLPVMALVMQKDFGPVVLLFGFFILSLYLATGNVLQPLLLLFSAIGIGWIGYVSHTPSTLVTRVNAWLDPFNTSEHLSRALWSFASGGFWGKGWGLGQPHKIPLAYSDFIVTAIAEEIGFVGMAAICILFAVLIIRGLYLAYRCQEPIDSLLSASIVFMLSIQAFLVIGGVAGAIPLAGLTLPFVALGGSSLVINFAMLGILLRISRDLETL